MGYVGATISLEVVRKKMGKSRTVFTKDASSPKAKKFCKDAFAFNVICRHYRYLYSEWNGNIEGIHKDSFANYYYLIKDKYSYDELMDSLKEDYRNSKSTEAKYLIDGFRKLRQEYR